MVRVIVNGKKHLFESRTFWVGILQILLAIAMAVVDEYATGAALTISGIAMIALRIISKSKIEFK